MMATVIPIESAKAAAGVRPGRIGVLLVNLGTPDTADARGVRVYLREFLSDPRVIEDQGLVWKLVLNGIILRIRPGRKARDYRKIWNAEKNESPLKTITRAQADKLAASISDHDHLVVDWAMRYGNPSIRSRIDALTAQGCDRLLVVPLYPQYSAATSATVCDEVFRILAAMRAQPTLRVTPPYYDDPDYIEALAVSIDAHLATLPFQPELIVASFHGMPQKYVDNGDPYQAQCIATTEALRKRMGLDASRLLLTFQSRFGFDEWLQPYTDKTMEKLAKDGVRRIAVVMPGFSADCLETPRSSNATAASSLPRFPVSTIVRPGWTSSASWCCASFRAGFEPARHDPATVQMTYIWWPLNRDLPIIQKEPPEPARPPLKYTASDVFHV
jgi:protoporphyrin/coproporphyrin ferrochelatase